MMMNWRHFENSLSVSQFKITNLQNNRKDFYQINQADTLIGLIASNEDAQHFYRSLPDSEIRDEGIWINL